MFGKSNLVNTERVVRETVERIVRDAMGDAQNALRLTGQLTTLRGELETLKIEKGRREEEFAKREREVEHKVGLERKRSEFEREQAKREATVAVREENLKADRQRFEDQLKFYEGRFTQELGALKEILSDVIKRLPSAEFTADLGVRRVRHGG